MLVRKGSVLAAGLAVLLGFGCVAGGAAAQTTSVGRAARIPVGPALVSPAALVELRRAVLNASRAVGVPNPKHLRAVATNSDAAARAVDSAPGGISSSLVPIYVGCARGHFPNLGDGRGLSSLCVIMFAQTGTLGPVGKLALPRPSQARSRSEALERSFRRSSTRVRECPSRVLATR
jgi:hypothetical protein